MTDATDARVRARAWRLAARRAVDRLDVLEDSIPRQSCQVRGCGRNAPYEWAGAFGTRWLCSRHRPLYRDHDAILRRIRNL